MVLYGCSSSANLAPSNEKVSVLKRLEDLFQVAPTSSCHLASSFGPWLSWLILKALFIQGFFVFKESSAVVERGL